MIFQNDRFPARTQGWATSTWWRTRDSTSIQEPALWHGQPNSHGPSTRIQRSHTRLPSQSLQRPGLQSHSSCLQTLRSRSLTSPPQEDSTCQLLNGRQEAQPSTCREKPALAWIHTLWSPRVCLAHESSKIHRSNKPAGVLWGCCDTRRTSNRVISCHLQSLSWQKERIWVHLQTARRQTEQSILGVAETGLWNIQILVECQVEYWATLAWAARDVEEDCY